MIRALAGFLGFSLLAGCALVAGLDDFQPAGGGGAQSQGGESSEGGGGASLGGSGGHGGSGGGGEGCADDIIISEIRTVGTGAGDDDFIELHNPTARTISLGDLAVWARPPSSMSLVLRWEGIAGQEIGPGEFRVIGGAGFDDIADKDFDLMTSLGDQSIVLLQRGPEETPKTIDIVCVCTDDCSGTEWMGCQDVVLKNAAWVDGAVEDVDDSLQRIPSCLDTDRASDFEVHPSTPREENGP
ncbi:MAG: hypothetical protein HOW73_44370 [Polyangiaceae bacterium]|nr:hypothetical protein [Polyangiaceae bacterium]